MLPGSAKGVVSENVREARNKGLSERDAVLTSMKQSKKTAKRDMMPSPSKGEEYPYGLKVHLEHDDLHKLRINKLPKAGAMHTFTAHAKVTRAEESSSVDGGKKRSMTLQIQKMRMHEPSEDTRDSNGDPE